MRPRLDSPPARWSAIVVLTMLGLIAAGCGAEEAQADSSSEEAVAADGTGSGESAGAEADAVPETTTTTIPVRPVVSIPESWPSDVDELFGRYWLYWEAFAAAHAPPYADPSFEQLRQLSTEENWRSLQEQLSGFAEDGLVLVLPPGSVTEHLIRLPNAEVLDKSEGVEVLIQDCWIDDFVQQTVDGAVVEVTKEAKLMNVSLKVVDGQWRVDGVARASSESDGYEQCEALL